MNHLLEVTATSVTVLSRDLPAFDLLQVLSISQSQREGSQGDAKSREGISTALCRGRQRVEFVEGKMQTHKLRMLLISQQYPCSDKQQACGGLTLSGHF